MRDRAVRAGSAKAYTVPTDAPEGDGTFQWDSTTIVVVELEAQGATGLGYTYTHKVAAPLVRTLLRKCVIGADCLATARIFERLRAEQRNYGTEGIAATALSAIDIALWDLKAKLLGVALCDLLGSVREGAPVYGSGGFTTYTDAQLQAQLGGWAEQGIPRVKMKVGADPARDPYRAAIAREAIGDDGQLFVDANGAYSRTQAAEFAALYAEDFGVVWFEEPVTSDDLPGLQFVRDGAPPGMDIAAGEYGWDAMYLRRMIDAEAVDVIQADATRCGGVTGFMQAAALAETYPLPLSAHCGPSIHLHLGCAANALRHVEYFHDHARIEQMLFEGFCTPRGGVMYPDRGRPGLGLEFKPDDAEQFRDDL